MRSIFLLLNLTQVESPLRLLVFIYSSNIAGKSENCSVLLLVIYSLHSGVVNLLASSISYIIPWDPASFKSCLSGVVII